MEPLIAILIQLLVLVLILIVIVWVAQLVIGAFGGPPQALTIVKAICALIALLWLLNLVGGYVPLRPWR